MLIFYAVRKSSPCRTAKTPSSIYLRAVLISYQIKLPKGSQFGEQGIHQIWRLFSLSVRYRPATCLPLSNRD